MCTHAINLVVNWYQFIASIHTYRASEKCKYFYNSHDAVPPSRAISFNAYRCCSMTILCIRDKQGVSWIWHLRVGTRPGKISGWDFGTKLNSELRSEVGARVSIEILSASVSKELPREQLALIAKIFAYLLDGWLTEFHNQYDRFFFKNTMAGQCSINLSSWRREISLEMFNGRTGNITKLPDRSTSTTRLFSFTGWKAWQSRSFWQDWC